MKVSVNFRRSVFDRWKAIYCSITLLLIIMWVVLRYEKSALLVTSSQHKLNIAKTRPLESASGKHSRTYAPSWMSYGRVDSRFDFTTDKESVQEHALQEHALQRQRSLSKQRSYSRPVRFPTEAHRVAQLLLQKRRLSSKFFINIGARDGVKNDPVYPLYAVGWRGIAFEGDSAWFAKLKQNLDTSRVKMYEGFVTPDDIVKTLKTFRSPQKPGFLKIDIDGYDCPVLEAVLAGGYQPDLIQMEVNVEIPPPMSFSIQYTPGYSRIAKTPLFGCNIVYQSNLLVRNGYKLAQIAWSRNSDRSIMHDTLYVRGPLWENALFGEARGLTFWYDKVVDKILSICRKFGIEAKVYFTGSGREGFKKSCLERHGKWFIGISEISNSTLGSNEEVCADIKYLLEKYKRSRGVTEGIKYTMEC